jgi:outer membrane protein assembly factor BamB
VSRVWVRSLLAVVLTAAAVLIAVRVLRPAEVLATATGPDPLPIVHAPGVTGRTAVAPLIVDGRVRVFAAKRQVRADTPVDGKTTYTARWSFRRWPQQVSGVVATGRTVITRWSDGDLVALDALTGKIVWRASGPPAPAFAGHQTGASTVWAPPGFHAAGESVLVTAGSSLLAYAATTGARLWTTTVPAGCTDGFTTAGGAYVCPTAAFDTATGHPLSSWPPGPSTPIACEGACAGLRDSDGHGWSVGAPTPVRRPALDAPATTLVAGSVYQPPAGDVVLGTWQSRAVLLTPGRHVQEVDPRTGETTVDFPLRVGTERLDWNPGRFQIADGYLAVERLTAGGPADPDAPDHYLTQQTVILAAL